MIETHVISVLQAKRAEISGEILSIQARAMKLRNNLASIDRAIRVFDPTIHVGQIRAVRKRKTARQFRHGECSRTILDILRRAPSPMTAPEIAERLAVECRLDAGTPATMKQLVQTVKIVLGRHKGGAPANSRRNRRWACF